MATPQQKPQPQKNKPAPVTPVTRPATTPAQNVRPANVVSKPVMKVKRTEPRGNQVFLFDSTNYKWMIGGVVLILIGFFLMAGGKSPDPHQFNYDEIYSFRRITLAPLVILIGFFIEVYAIMKKPEEPKTI